MTRIEQCVIDNNLIPDLSSVSGKITVQLTVSEIMHRCQVQKQHLMSVHSFVDGVKVFDRICQICSWRKLESSNSVCKKM